MIIRLYECIQYYWIYYSQQCVEIRLFDHIKTNPYLLCCHGYMNELKQSRQDSGLTVSMRRTDFLMSFHDDVIKWKHFPRYWPFLRGIHRSPVNSPHKGQWRGGLMFYLICVWINGWVNNREAGDFETLSRPLWHHRNAWVPSSIYVITHCSAARNSRLFSTFWWCHNGHHGVLNHRRLDHRSNVTD